MIKMPSPHQNLGKFGKDAAFRLIGILIQNLIFLLTAWLITRFLGAGSLGDFILAITVFNILGLASTLGMKEGSLRFVAFYLGRGDDRRVGGTIRTSICLALFTGVILGGLLSLTSGWLARGVFHAPQLERSFFLLGPALPFLAVSIVVISSLQGFKKIRTKVILENLLQPLLALGLISSALILGFSLTSAVGGWSVSVLVSFLVGAIILFRIRRPHRRPVTPPLEFKKLLAFSLPLMGVGFLYYIFTRMDILMLGYFKSSSDVGIYAIVARLAILIEIPLSAVNVIFEPTVAEISGRKKESELGGIYRTATRWIVLAGLPIFVLLILLAPPLTAFFGRSFAAGIPVLIILGLGQLINIGVGSSGALLSMTGHPRLNLFNTIAMVALNFILNYLLIPRMGIIGAALATTISISLINILRLAEVKRVLNLRPFSAPYFKTILAAAGACLPTLAVRHLLPPAGAGLLRALAPAGVYIAVYPALLLALRVDIKVRILLNALVRPGSEDYREPV